KLSGVRRMSPNENRALLTPVRHSSPAADLLRQIRCLSFPALFRSRQRGVENAVAFAVPDRQLVDSQNRIVRLQNLAEVSAAALVGRKRPPGVSVTREPMIR